MLDVVKVETKNVHAINKQHFKPDYVKSNDKKLPLKCFNCGGSNHIAKFCKHPKKRHVRAVEVVDKSDDSDHCSVIDDNKSLVYKVFLIDNKKVDFTKMIDFGSESVPFAVDTQAEISIVPKYLYDKYSQSFGNINRRICVTLLGYGGDVIPHIGKVFCKPLNVNVMIVDKSNTQPILGQDCIVENRWKPEYKDKSMSVCRVSMKDCEFKSEDDETVILDKAKTSFKKLFCNKTGKVDFRVQIELEDNAKPVCCATPHSIAYALYEPTRKKLLKKENDGLIRKVSCPQWASPINVLYKPNGSIRITGDYSTGVNKAIKTYPSVMPITDDILNVAHGRIFSVIDIRDAFTAITLHEKSKFITTLCTPFGYFEYNRLPQGLKISPLLY
uniref:CCHC-type domain-containing protein n=1 Tax=Strongyloides papillosus TaxID=174720 RepID=A0A0N5B358_STREA